MPACDWLICEAKLSSSRLLPSAPWPAGSGVAALCEVVVVVGEVVAGVVAGASLRSTIIAGAPRRPVGSEGCVSTGAGGGATATTRATNGAGGSVAAVTAFATGAGRVVR